MNDRWRLFPEQASTAAARTDALYFFLIAVTAFFTILIFVLIVYMALKYRRRTTAAPPKVHTNYTLELVWTVIPFIITMIIFFWGARLYFFINRPPANALPINIVGKQWMWKAQHPNGRREIDELHVPLGQPVRLMLASQDVIHSYYIPEFRIKQDAVPGRYTVTWFQATQVGTYHLFCAEYCGTQHSGMIGHVFVMEPDKYQAWLVATPVEDTPAAAGAKLFVSLGCLNCHAEKAPTMAGLYMSKVKLADGREVVADEEYLRTSILFSTQDVVAGFAPQMPSFRGQVSEEQVLDLISYIKSLRNPELLKKTN